MHTLVHSPRSRSRAPGAALATPEAFRQPNYDCREQPDAMQLVVYVPGVPAAGVEIEARGADLTVTARKPHLVRVNWQALHLENAQRDYRLGLRLGRGFNYAAMEAEIADGVLTITLPKRVLAEDHSRWRRVA
jgi:HSP20 family protein